MMICPNLRCRKVLQVPGQYRGQQVKCHYCGTTFAVPATKTGDKTKESGQSKQPEQSANKK